MVFDCNHHSLAIAVLLLFSLAPQHVRPTTITSSPGATETPSPAPTCEFRTINYITDSLPQLCFLSSWSANGTSSTSSVVSESVSPTLIAQKTQATDSSGNPIPGHETVPSVTVNINISVDSPTGLGGTTAPEDLEPSELNEASFLSFEEWKKQALEKAGQQDANIGGRKPYIGENRKKDSENINNNLDTVGEDGEIELDFGAFSGDGKGQEASQTGEAKGPEVIDESNDQAKEKRRKDHYRSKDAGITCKERFSYASFDAGATVLKTHPGAKNPKAVLVENKDSYMLSQCSTENKFIIIELSEDIWIDTIVLSNYEFFSSMVRQFRVSVSDRYPVKMEKWKDAGTYEARNSRDIQAFLIENPQIWARYLRIEFLSHYGNEYYCPLSLVRVHGTRMLESWKESEAIGEEEDSEEGEGGRAGEQFVPDAVADVVQEEERLNAELRAAAESIVRNANAAAEDARSAEALRLANATTPWIKSPFMFSNKTDAATRDDICLPAEGPIKPLTATSATISTAESTASEKILSTDKSTTMVSSTPQKAPVTTQSEASITTENATMAVTPSVTSPSYNTTVSSSSTAALISTSSPPPPIPPASKVQNSTIPQRNKTTSTSSAASSLPTIQESFFKAVSRRLQLLEANSTLSLKYIEEQSKILREAFSKVEKKQLQKSTSFLDGLNNTVLAELRGFRQQYDEIWQSTVISLESQREESRKEILGISARLNILADEVVFQKRMSIVQSVLLLLCLGLVIFSRVSTSGQLDFPMTIRSRNMSADTFQSPPESPTFRGIGHLRNERSWVETSPARQQSRESALLKSIHRGVSPTTPISADSRSEHNFTPPPDPGDLSPERGGDAPVSRPEYLEPSVQRSRSNSAVSQEPRNGVPGSSTPTSPPRKRKKRKGSLRQPTSPAASGSDLSENVSRGTTPQSHQINIIVSPSSRLPSPPEEDDQDNASFDSTRKPLPALPTDGE